MNKGYWHYGTYIPTEETDPRRIELAILIANSHRLRSRYMALKVKKWGRAALQLPVTLAQALGKYGHSVAQPWRLTGDRIAHGNRR